MSANNKALILMIALVAFVIGAAYNSARTSDVVDSSPLLNAKLLSPPALETGEQLAVSVGEQLGSLTLVNFWASWCAPCREEMPIFETMFRASKDRGFQIIGVAIDSPDKAQPMLDSMDITYPIMYAEKSGMNVMESAGNPQGLLPYSLLLNKDGQLIEQVLGRISEQQIQAWLNDHL